MCLQIVQRAGFSSPALRQRQRQGGAAGSSSGGSGSGAGAGTGDDGKGMAQVPHECPQVPDTYQPRPAAESELLELLAVPAGDSGDTCTTSSSKCAIVRVLGMGTLHSTQRLHVKWTHPLH